MTENSGSHCSVVRYRDTWSFWPVYDVIIPPKVEGKPVKVLLPGSFEKLAIRRLVLPSSVQTIGDRCFSGCIRLSVVMFEAGSNLEKIGNCAFHGCSHLSRLTLPKSVKSIGKELFGSKSISCVTFEEGIRIERVAGISVRWEREDYAVILREVDEIPERAFMGFGTLRRVSFENGTSIKVIGSSSFSYTGLETFEVPKSLEKIGADCFRYCPSLKSLALEEEASLHTICSGAFSDTSLKCFRFPDSMTQLESTAFQNCQQLTTVVFGKNCKLKYLSSSLFVSTGLTMVQVPKSVECIRKECFKDCSRLSGLTFEPGSNLKRIEKAAFKGAGLGKSPGYTLRLPKSLEEIGDEGFMLCPALSSVEFEEGSQLKRIGHMAFSGCPVTDFVVPKSVEELGDYVFQKRNFFFHRWSTLSRLTFEDGSELKKIGNGAFYYTNITSVIIPEHVEVIGEYCFDGSPLSQIDIRGSKLRSVGYRAFPSNYINLHVPTAEVEAYSDLLIGKNKYTGLSRDKVVVITTGQTPPSLSEEGSESDSESESQESEYTMPISDFITDISDCQEVRRIQRPNGCEVAIYRRENQCLRAKFIPAVDQRIQDRFECEVDALRTISHPFVESLHGCVLPIEATNNSFVIITNYIPGITLQEAMDAQPRWFDDTTKAMIICSIAIGMEFAHSKGIIHRDLKPKNILIDESYHPHITDFGMSITSGIENVTAPYGAPEIYMGSQITDKVDVYSFGAILYEIGTGRKMFSGMSVDQQVDNILSGRRDQVPAGVTPFTSMIIDSCLSPHPDDRMSFTEIVSLVMARAHELFPSIQFDRLSEFANDIKTHVRGV